MNYNNNGNSNNYNNYNNSNGNYQQNRNNSNGGNSNSYRNNSNEPPKWLNISQFFFPKQGQGYYIAAEVPLKIVDAKQNDYGAAFRLLVKNKPEVLDMTIRQLMEAVTNRPRRSGNNNAGNGGNQNYQNYGNGNGNQGQQARANVPHAPQPATQTQGAPVINNEDFYGQEELNNIPF